MSFYYCPNCGGVYLGKALNLEYGPCNWAVRCPNASCDGEAFEIDEEMIIPIKILRQKGYITSYCCSGHVYTSNNGGYIRFDTDFIEMPETSPDGWFFDGSNTIRYRDRDADDSDIKKRSYQHVQINRLIRWCQELPPATPKVYD